MSTKRFTFVLNVTLTLGDPKDFSTRDWVATTFNVDTIITNAPCPQFIGLTDVQVDVADMLYDANNPNPVWDGVTSLRCRREEMAHGARVLGHYTGLIPAGYSPGQKYTFSVTFQGNK